MEKKKEIAVEEPVSTAGITIVPVVMTSSYYQRVDSTVSVAGFKHPINIVIITPTTKKAFRITGEEISIERLVLEVPALEKALRKAI